MSAELHVEVKYLAGRGALMARPSLSGLDRR
jgi:hypothetical protein